jgi:hypothetical protein
LVEYPPPVEANVKPTAQGLVVKSRGEPAATIGRQISYSEVGAAYAGIVAGQAVKGANTGVDFSAPPPRKEREEVREVFRQNYPRV